MGAIGGMFGLSGGMSGTGYAAPTTQNVVGDPINQGLTDTAYQGTQNTLQQQQSLLQALQGQNALSNQNQVYGQLQKVAAGQGPNPAQAMLNQSTGQNIAAQGALMAGQRGVGANPALIARQIAMQGANTQQQAVGQAATLQAQQSLNALGQAGGMANTQASNLIGQTNANTGAQQNLYNALLGAQANVNNANVGLQSNANTIQGQLANTVQQGQQQAIGGIFQGAGAAAGMAEGGTVGGDASAFNGNGAQSKFGQFLNGMGSQIGGGSADSGQFSGGGAMKAGTSSFVSGIGKKIKSGAPGSDTMAGGTESSALAASPMMIAAQGGRVPAMVSPGERLLNPNEAKAVAKGTARPDEVGKTVPGKPKYPGNNYANDTVPAKLTAGGVVIPNDIMQSKDPVRGAAEFVRAHVAKRGRK